MSQQDNHDRREMTPRMARILRLTRAGMWWEAVARAFWPLAALLLVIAAALLLGLPPALPALVLPWLIGVALICVTGAAVAGALRFRRPPPGAEWPRVDRLLPDRPLTALRDHAALGGEGALWQAHRAQMEARATHARAVAPDAGLARRDPFALRLVAVTALVMAVLFGSTGQVGQGISAITATWRPDLGALPRASGGGWEGWAVPPAYTGRPTIYLNDHPDGAQLALPQGTRLGFRLYGEGVAVEQSIGTQTGDDPMAPEYRLERDGTLRISGQRFNITMQPDAPPVIEAGAIPERRVDGRFVQRFTASDDFGVTGGRAVITLDLDRVDRRFGLAAAPAPREAVELALPLPPRDRQRVVGELSADLMKHPWANLPVVMQLYASDGLEQESAAAPVAMVLPGRRFFDPLAAAMIELRRDLLWSPENLTATAQQMRALIWQPEGFMDETMARGLHGIVLRIEQGDLPDEAREQIAETLWQVAVQLEDGGLDDAIERMRRAQERLSEAIRQGASPQEIQRLMNELREATEAYKRALPVNEDEADSPGSRRPDVMLSGDQIQQMMDEIERLMSEGRMAEAQELLEQFNRMMENLQMWRGEGGEGEGSPGGEPSQRLGETLREQQRLSDEAFRNLQDRNFGGSEDKGASTGELAERQGELRQDLGRQRGLLPGRGTSEGDAVREDLDRAGRAMEQAEEALRRGDIATAMQLQAEAIEAMRGGMRALDRLEGRDGAASNDGTEGGDEAEAADPLGRSAQGLPGDGVTSRDMLDDSPTDQGRRARDLQDEIRRRMGDPARPQDERDYLDRLLDGF